MTDKHTLVWRLRNDNSNQPYTERHEAATRITALEAREAELVERLEMSQLGLTVLANMMKRIDCKRGEAVAVEYHRMNAATLAKHQEGEG